MKNANNKSLVLVVDDSPENIDVMTQILKCDYQVKFAKNGKVAIEMTKLFKPDLILLDIIMQGMNGYEVCEYFKSNPKTKDIPIIFVTSKDDAFDEAKGFELGAVDYITKPVSEVVVKARVKTHIELHNQQAALSEQVMIQNQEVLETRLEIIKCLSAAAEYRDEDTGNHVFRMSHYCYEIAKSYGYSERDALILLNASPMHDVGKIGIPDHILLKPGKLNDEEWAMMQKHTIIGEKILGEHKSSLMSTARTIAIQHHERWDGSGYPKGLRETEININARIAAVADVFDALTSERPYKRAWSIEKSVEEIKCNSGAHFDPEIVNVFINTLPKILEIKEEYKN